MNAITVSHLTETPNVSPFSYEFALRRVDGMWRCERKKATLISDNGPAVLWKVSKTLACMT
ncbi:hypothetical protein C6Q09_24640 [Burkholderia multivorans]|uniref:hypothetical protein n=1 Tax=Burkholderia multivorans TaxID=87883 RepID=UPI000CFFB50E|nr:hypothetical protein [Burkholderia multivorans]PRF64451.1 hypothetical protein C6Q09_24640 [Burkholderia multivorans]